MGLCESCNQKPSFRCTYEVKDNNPVQIINDRDENDITNINTEIGAKIKILKDNQKEKLTFEKTFDIIGLNTIDFVIEEKITNMSFMFNQCSSLKNIQFMSFDT